MAATAGFIPVLHAATDSRPDEIDSILQLRAEQQRISQIQSNLTVEQTHAQAADGALTNAIKLMDRARVLVAQGATGTTDSAGRKAIAQEVHSLLEEMIACSRTSVQRRFVFSGDSDGNPPYQPDSTSPTGRPSALATSLPVPAATMPSGTPVPATSPTPRWTMPSPPTTTKASSGCRSACCT